jgi:type II secretory pathway pseudopilin PulG
MHHAPRAAQSSAGFTFVGLLIWIAISGVALAALGQLWSTAARRERERELLFVGAQFRDAIGRYYEQSPGAKQYPRTLEELLQDPRVPVVRRHLRRIYLDPMTGKPDWVLVKQGDQLVGVASASSEKPLKTAGFAPADEAFTDAATYADWRFVYTLAGAPAAGGAQVPTPAPAPTRTQ